MLLILVLSFIALSAAQNDDNLDNVNKAAEKLKELSKPATIDLK